MIEILQWGIRIVFWIATIAMALLIIKDSELSMAFFIFIIWYWLYTAYNSLPPL